MRENWMNCTAPDPNPDASTCTARVYLIIIKLCCNFLFGDAAYF